MSVQDKELVLSRFFNPNVQFVAKMCPKCYEECTDVKILSISLSFLKQVDNDFQNVCMNVFNTFLEVEEENFVGFSIEDMVESANCNKKLKQVVDSLEKVIKNKDGNNNDEAFLGFSSRDVIEARHNYNKFLDMRKLVQDKVELISVRSVCRNKRIRHRKTRRRKELEIKSRYFTFKSEEAEGTAKFNEDSRNFKLMPGDQGIINGNATIVKEEPKKEPEFFSCAPSQQNIPSHLIKTEKCAHFDMYAEPSEIKTNEETLYYESIYFKTLNISTYFTKAKVKKEGFENGIPVEKPSSWRPPRSPHNLIEEVLYHDPWALLIATIFLNKTTCMCARPYVFWFLSENSSPLKVLEKIPQDLEKYFVKLGLQRIRSVRVWRMSHDFIYKKWKNVTELYGVGKYGENAFKMFCQGDFNVAPKDRFLRIYKAWYEKNWMGQQMKKKELEM